MIQKIRFLISLNHQYIITTLKLNLTHYEHSPINIGEIQSISNSGIISTFLVPPDGPWLAGPCFCDVVEPLSITSTESWHYPTNISLPIAISNFVKFGIFWVFGRAMDGSMMPMWWVCHHENGDDGELLNIFSWKLVWELFASVSNIWWSRKYINCFHLIDYPPNEKMG